jgi:hypothetical protein
MFRPAGQSSPTTKSHSGFHDVSCEHSLSLYLSDGTKPCNFVAPDLNMPWRAKGQTIYTVLGTLGARPNSSGSILRGSDSRLRYEQAFSPLECRSDIAAACAGAGLCAEGHVPRFIVELVRESLDLKEINGQLCESVRGAAV